MWNLWIKTNLLLLLANKKQKDQNMKKTEHIVLAVLVSLLSNDKTAELWRAMTLKQQRATKLRLTAAINDALSSWDGPMV